MVLEAMQTSGFSVEHIPEFDSVTDDHEEVLLWKIRAREDAAEL